MNLKTHLAVIFLFIILFIPHISSLSGKILFFVSCLIFSILPDLDSEFSTLGRNKIMRPLQIAVKHRAFIHSFTFCIFITIILIFFLPILAFSFFLGYSIHLFLDSFTPEGIAFFWPSKLKSSGKIRTGGVLDNLIFIIFLAVDMIMLLFTIINLFG